MALSARDELKQVAEPAGEAEAVVCLAGPELLRACKALLALVGRAPRQYLYDPELAAVLDEAQAAVAMAEGRGR
jgi:hypothetical protein